jgi:hypothetical protein
MSNTIVIGLNDRNKWKPLRGDCQGANLDYAPTDAAFPAKFHTEDAKNYTLNSIHKFFIDGQVANSITIGGRAGLKIEMVFDPSRAMWVVVDHNLNAGTGTGTVGPAGPRGPAGINGTNGTNGQDGITPVINATVETLAAGQPATVTVTGPITNRVFAFGIPTGPRGLPGTGGTGTGGAAFVPEVLLTQAADGSITMDKTLHGTNAYRVLLTKKLIVNNPVGYNFGEELMLTIRQPLTGGPFDAEWGLAFGHPDRQPPKLATKPGGVNRARMTLTESIGAEHPELWETDCEPKNSTIGYGAPSFIAQNINRGTKYYVLRSPTLLAGMTDMQPGETLKLLRDGLGVEAYGAIEGTGNFVFSGARPDGGRFELKTGPGVRTAFDRGILVSAGNANATFQDVILTSAREQSGSSHIAHGIQVSSSGLTKVRNVKITDCENGIGSGNADFFGTLELFNVELDANGVGDDGLTHNLYTGRHPQGITIEQSTSMNCIVGHNLKHRDGVVIHRRVLNKGTKKGRELNIPNGTNGTFEHCWYWKYADCSQGQLISIGEEGIETSRVHAYVWRNCRFQNDVSGGGRDVPFIINHDRVVMYFIDCEFIGDTSKNLQADPNGNSMFDGMITQNGIRYYPEVPPVFQYTGGPLGPQGLIGVQAIPVIQL